MGELIVFYQHEIFGSDFALRERHDAVPYTRIFSSDRALKRNGFGLMNTCDFHLAYKIQWP